SSSPGSNFKLVTTALSKESVSLKVMAIPDSLASSKAVVARADLKWDSFFSASKAACRPNSLKASVLLGSLPRALGHRQQHIRGLLLLDPGGRIPGSEEVGVSATGAVYCMSNRARGGPEA